VDILGFAETSLRKEDIFNENVMVRKDDTEIQEKDSLNRNCRGKRGIIVLKNNKNKTISLGVMYQLKLKI
jgi:hypothetical protein